MAKKQEKVKLVFLIGMPAAGKTYWGNRIADEFKRKFIDLDDYVTEQEKASVQALFAMYGENGFREREQKHLLKAISTITTDTIFACGGGTPCFGDNVEVLKKAGVIVYLQADVSLLLENLKKDDKQRPLLNNRGDLQTYLENILAKRKKFYEQAHHTLPVKDISISNFAKILAHV